MSEMKPLNLIIIGFVFFIILFLILPYLAPIIVPDDKGPIVYLLYASAGSLSQLLDTNQIDAFLIWEPVVSNTELAGIGKMIATPSDIPPPGKWQNSATCVLLLRNNIIEQYPDISALLSALTTAAINQTIEDPDLAKQITAAWVYGTKPVLTQNSYLQPLDIENLSFNNMEFTANANPPVSGIVSNLLETMNNEIYNPEDMVQPKVAIRGNQFLNGTSTPGTSAINKTINIGYLPSSDNFAPLYVMVRDYQYFCNKYNFCLVPDDKDESRPVKCTLFVNGSPVAHVNLIPGQSGGGIMTTVGQKALDGAYVGSIPAEQQIGLGNPSSIIESILTGGSGLVVKNTTPCNDWNSFLIWTKVRSAQGNPIVIATVQSSIQEDMIREAFAYENISVKLYGTTF